MSVIQKIRDKYARWAVIAIAVSLLGFILMDAFAGRTGLFSNSQSNTLGKVNGTAIDRLDFDKKVKLMENQYASQNYQLTDEQRQQMSQSLWDQEVNDIVMKEEYRKLGLTVTDKELQDILYGANPPQDIKQGFTDPKTKLFDANAARAEVNRQLKDPTRKDQLERYFDNLKSQRLLAKYMALMTNTITFPKWFLEKRNLDNSLMAKISYITIPYSSIPDSTIKISDDEIKSYIKDHEDQFEQKEESRSVEYVLFSASPNASDSATARNELLKLKDGFDSTKNPQQFLQANNSTFPYYDNYLSKKAIQQQNKDSILAQPVGKVYGPYLDISQNANGSLYVMSKIIDEKQWPDTVKVRHILIATSQRDQQGQMVPTRPDSVAKKLADSVFGLLNKGQNFDSLVVKYSEDPGSVSKGGVYDSITPGQMTTAFNDYVFEHKPGEKSVVKTEFGYHIIEILSQKGMSPAYKVAYLSREIIASPETDQEAHNQANMFAGDSRDLSSFNSNYEKKLHPKGLLKMAATDISPMAYTIDGMPGAARTFVKEVFDASKGDVIGPERVGANYVVAIVTEVNEPGLRSVNSARSAVEPNLRNKKKSEMIAKNIGTITTLEAAAAKTNQAVLTIDSLRFAGGRQLGFEPRVLGASFNPANKGKVVTEPLAGTTGVFVLRVDNLTTTPVEAANVEEQRKMLEMQARQGLMSQIQQGQGNPIIDVLRRAANVKDNRAKFF
jgi:peptidyl-prolyl cis-trans isomerase D